MAFRFALEKLELQNFHRFEHYSIDFDKSLTVLVGDNGAGKSSILAAASVALGSFLFYLRGTEQRKLLRSDARLVQTEMGGVIDSQEQYPVAVKATGVVGECKDQSSESLSVTWERSLLSSDGETTYQNARSITSVSKECESRVQSGDASLILPVLCLYGTDRLWVKSNAFEMKRRQPFTRLDGYSNAFSARANSDQLLTWFYKMAAQDAQRALSLKPAGANPLYAAVRSAVEKCFKAITHSERVNVLYNFDIDDLDIEYSDESGQVQKMSLSYLSDGYRGTLSMFADIAYRMALLNPVLGDGVLETPGVVLIDEVDLHLHPLWQARILGDLRRIFPNVQFIVTTHAPTVISSVGAHQIRLLNGGEAAITPKTEVFGGDADRILSSVLGAPERPQAIQDRFEEFYRLLDARDFEAARKVLDELGADIGDADTDLVAARTALTLEEADARYAAD